MRQLRVLMQPIRTEGPGGRAIVSGFDLDFSPLGRATGPALDQATAIVELSCILISKIRRDERSEPVPLVTLSGTLSVGLGGVDFTLAAPPQQPGNLTDPIESDGHRRPRRRLLLRLSDATELPLLLPDLVQVTSGFMQITAKLTVNGDVHADVDQNEVLDVPLLPLRLTHAVFELVDGAGQPLKQVTASFETSEGETLEATTDDFGEIFLDGAQGQTYSLLELLPSDDDRVAVVETRIDESAAVA
jgi:hypothetical protein